MRQGATGELRTGSMVFRIKFLKDCIGPCAVNKLDQERKKNVFLSRKCVCREIIVEQWEELALELEGSPAAWSC